MESGELGSGDGVGGLGLGGWSWGVELGGLGSGGGIEWLGSGGCSWFESTLKILQLIYKYLVVSCAVFNYLVLGLKVPCSFLWCFQLPCNSYKSIVN